MEQQKYILIIFILLALGAIIYLFINNNSHHHHERTTSTMPPMTNHIENFANVMSAPAEETQVMSRFEDVPEQSVVSGSEEIGYNEQPQSLGSEETGTQMNQLPSECYPKDVLSSIDLLPQDPNTLWAQVSPSGQGSLADQNFLTSGFHIGINTVGQTLRNANRQLRSEPINPQIKVSPWQQTTIEADVNRRPLEIGTGDL
tara:strand:+ start:273 stop:875 length:603 start_codon:yes stop_codon:yes gene_type:complete